MPHFLNHTPKVKALFRQLIEKTVKKKLNWFEKNKPKKNLNHNINHFLGRKVRQCSNPMLQCLVLGYTVDVGMV